MKRALAVLISQYERTRINKGRELILENDTSPLPEDCIYWKCFMNVGCRLLAHNNTRLRRERGQTVA